MRENRRVESSRGASDDETRGIGRRTLIKRAAATGAVAWTAPTILQSLTSPAGAVTPVGFPCSYVTVVYTLNGTGPFAIKIIQDATTCQLTNATSGDGTFSVPCGGHTYDNLGAGNAIRQDTIVIPAGASCPFTISGGQVTGGAGVDILFAIVHQGSCAGGPSQNFCPPICAPAGDAFAANCGVAA